MLQAFSERAARPQVSPRRALEAKFYAGADHAQGHSSTLTTCPTKSNRQIRRCRPPTSPRGRATSLALPDAVEQWSLTTLREKLVKIGAMIIRHGRYIVFQMAEVAIPRDLFADILRRIDRLRPASLPT